MLDMISTVTAAKILVVSLPTARVLLENPDKKITDQGRVHNYYSLKRVKAIKAARDAGTFKTPERKYPRTWRKKRQVHYCPTCNAVLKRKSAKCLVCDVPDPHNIMIKPKYGTKVCKICKKKIPIGMYKCPCQKWKASEALSLDAALAYGSLNW